MTGYHLNNENHKDLTDGLDYVVQAWCNENKLSGELAWLIIQSVAAAKLQTFKGRL